MLNDLSQDLRYGIRTLIQSPRFTLVAILILTLGIGANTTIFTLVNALFFQQPAEVAAPDQLVRVHKHIEGRPAWWSYPDYVFYRDHSRTLAGVAAYDPDGLVVTADLGAGGRTSLTASYVSANFFDLLGTRPAAGRSFRPDEGETPGTAPVVMLSHGLWRRSFGAQQDALGATVRLNGHPFTVIGVAPAGFRGASAVETPPDVWVPITMQPVLNPGTGDFLRRVEGETITWLQVLGRLAEGVGHEAAQEEMHALTTALGEQYAGWFREGQGVELLHHFQYRPQVRSRLLGLTRLLAAVVGLVLTIAGANVAILLLARASARRKDLGVRLAIGAGRGRIIRQLLVESLLLALAGGLGGYALAAEAAELAARTMPYTFSVSFAPDLRVLGFTLAVAVAAAVVFGVAPALQASRTDVISVLKQSDASSGRSYLRDGLVVAQVALSIVVVTGAMLFIRSLRTAESVDLGYETEHRLLIAMNLGNHGYENEDAGLVIEQALERLAALPGVKSATTTLLAPFRGSWSSTLSAANGIELEEGEELETMRNAVGPAYFETMGIPLLAGHGFRAGDREGAPSVAVINEAAAATFWPGRDPLGQTITWRGDDQEPTTVIGVARNVQHYELGESPLPLVYQPTMQGHRRRVNFLLHTTGDPMALSRPAQEAIHALDPDIAFSTIQTMEETVERVLGPYRVGATLVSLFGLLALVLAAAGLYGVLSYLVVQRTRTIGIQMALGASRQRVARNVVARGLRLTIFGAILGIAAAFAASTLVASFLYGISPRDPLSYLTVPLILAAVACLASWLPAQRAARIHPMQALREE